MNTVRVPRKLPTVLSPEEVTQLLDAAPSPKHKAALAVDYGAGLRASEVVALKISDIDGQRMTLRVEQGKGRKDRFAMLSPALLNLLRDWWRIGRAQGLMLNGGWLFPGQNPVNPLSTRQLNRACHATHLLEQKVDSHINRFVASCTFTLTSTFRLYPSITGCSSHRRVYWYCLSLAISGSMIGSYTILSTGSSLLLATNTQATYDTGTSNSLKSSPPSPL